MLLGFNKRFVPCILEYTKVFTMRKRRKKPAKIGETLFMYTGLRTNNCQLISNKEKLISKQKAWIRIIFTLGLRDADDLKVCVDGREIKGEELDQFVCFDGFKDKRDFIDYWIEPHKKLIKKNGMVNSRVKIVECLIIHHWTDLKY